MPDLLVKLYDLPVDRPALDATISVRPVMAAEISTAITWIERAFSRGWADEFAVGAYASPARSIIAVEDRQIIGFVCHDVSALGLFGPTGVDVDHRGRGLGTALLLAALDAMKARGHAYAVIGWAGPVKFYENLVGATVITGSEARYKGKLLKPNL